MGGRKGGLLGKIVGRFGSPTVQVAPVTGRPKLSVRVKFLAWPTNRDMLPGVMEMELAEPDGTTLKGSRLLISHPIVTTTGPVVAPCGTGTSIAPLVQLVVAAPIPLNAIVSVPERDPSQV